jgi:hypothetical protein
LSGVRIRTAVVTRLPPLEPVPSPYWSRAPTETKGVAGFTEYWSDTNVNVKLYVSIQKRVADIVVGNGVRVPVGVCVGVCVDDGVRDREVDGVGVADAVDVAELERVDVEVDEAVALPRKEGRAFE